MANVSMQRLLSSRPPALSVSAPVLVSDESMRRTDQEVLLHRRSREGAAPSNPYRRTQSDTGPEPQELMRESSEAAKLSRSTSFNASNASVFRASSVAAVPPSWVDELSPADREMVLSNIRKGILYQLPPLAAAADSGEDGPRFDALLKLCVEERNIRLMHASPSRLDYIRK